MPSTTSRSRLSPFPRSPSPRRKSSARSASTRPSREFGGARGSPLPADYRRISALGTSLIRLAVSSAHARGCRRFYAHVQSQNAPMFRRLHWHTIEEIAASRPSASFHARPISTTIRRLPTPKPDSCRYQESGVMLGAVALGRIAGDAARLPRPCRRSAILRRSPRDLSLSADFGRRRSATTARPFRTAMDFCCSPSKAS